MPRAISTKIEIISTTRGVVTENLSDLDSGRRPELESDEFSVTTPLIVEILGREFDTFPKKVYTYWDFGSFNCFKLVPVIIAQGPGMRTEYTVIFRQ